MKIPLSLFLIFLFYYSHTLLGQVTLVHFNKKKDILVPADYLVYSNTNGNLKELDYNNLPASHTASTSIFIAPYLYPGYIESAQVVCHGVTPTTLKLIDASKGSEIKYTWQYATETDSSTFIDINEHTEELNFENLSSTEYPTGVTYYRVQVSVVSTTTVSHTQAVSITTQIPSLSLKHNGEGGAFCMGDTIVFTATASQTGNFIFYLNNVAVKQSTISSTQSSYTLKNADRDINLVVHFESTEGCTSQSSLSLQLNNLSGGEISGPANVCANNQNILLSSILPGTANGKALTPNTFSYQWQSSLDGVNYTDMLSGTTEEYTLSLLTTDTHFRRLLKNTLDGTQCEESSNTIKISLSNSAFQPSSIQVSTSLCNVGIYATYQGGNPPYKAELYDTEQNLIDSGSTNGSQSFENLFPGKFYTLKVTDSNCSLPKEIVVQVPFEISFDRNKVSLQYDLCKEQPTDRGQGSISVATDAFTGGSNTFNYSWTGPVSFTGQGADISGLLPGTYLLTVTDEQLGCTQTESFVILGKDPLATTLKTTNLALDSDNVYQLSCQNDSSPTVEVNVTGGHSQYTYSWKKNGEVLTGTQTNKLTDISTGIYEVTVTDVPPAGVDVSNPCQTILSFKVEAPTPLSVKVDRTALETASCENATLQVPVTIAGGVSPYTITIEGHGSITTGQNSYTFTNVDPKKLGSNLKVSVVDQGNCSESAPDIALQSTGQYSFVSSTTNIDCLKGTLGNIQLILSQTLTGTQTLRLEWKGDTVHYFDTWANGNGLLKDLNNPGTYTVTVTNSNGCLVYAESFKIEDVSKGKLTVVIAQQKATTACGSANGAIQLEVNGGYPPYTFSWQQRSQTNSWTTLSVYDNHALISGLSSGTFRAIVSDASTALNNDRCSEKITTRDITIQQQSLKIVQFTASNAADLCNSNGSGQIRFQIQNTLTTTGTTAYSYQIDGVAVSSSQINDQANLIEINGISPGDHQLTVQVKSGSSDCSIGQDFSIEAPLAPITFSGQRTYESSLCNEATQIKIQTEDISGGAPFETGSPYALEWHYLPSEGDTSTVSHTRYGWEINNALSGTYQLVISDANRCQNDPSVPIIIKVEAPIAEPITVKGILKSDTGETVKVLPVQCGDEDKGTIGISIDGGIQPFEVRWYLFDPESIVNGNSTDGLKHLSAHDNQTLLDEVPVGIYRLEVKAPNTKCTSGTSVYSYYTEDIEITPNPTLHILSGPFIEDTICKGKPGRVTIEIFDNNQGNLYFYYEGKAIQKEAFEQINEQTYTLLIENPLEEGELEILNAEGCSIKHKINLALGTPDFSFTSPSLEATKNILIGEEIIFTNNSSNPYVKSEWLFGDFSAPLVQAHTATSSTVKYTYPTSGAYPVTLRIYNKNGCMEEATRVVSVGKGYNITLPNVFSPNNDGMNDHFRPLFSGFQEIEFSIFDPRGNQLYYETMKEPNPDHVEGFELTGWDASNANQALYYVYSVRGILFDKTEVDKSGTFILIQ